VGRAAEFGAWLVEGSAGWGAEPGQVWPSCCMQAAVVGLVVLLGLGCIVLLIGCLVSGLDCMEIAYQCARSAM